MKNAPASRVRALLWDVDGTIAETERDVHRVAFNQAFAAFGLPWRWSVERYGELLAVAGGRERLLHDMASRDDAPRLPAQRELVARRLHATKTALYTDLLRSARPPLRDGVLALMQECRRHGVRMGIATTTSRACVDALMGLHIGGRWTEWFDAVICGEDVRRKKPDPEVYTRALRQMRVHRGEAAAIEDSPAGVAAARAAGIPVLLARSCYFADAAIDGAIAVGPGLHDCRGWSPWYGAPAGKGRGIGLADIECWIAGAKVAQTERPS